MYSLSHICIHGPLKAHEAGFREWLAEHGCCVPSVRYQLELMDDLSRWLTRHGAGPGELTPAVVSEVLAARRARGHHLVSARGAGPLLGYLRGLGVVPGAARPAARTPRERLMEEYRSYLASERGLAEGTTGLHLRAAAMFLAGIPDPLSEGLRDLSAGQVTGIVSRGVRQCAVSTARGRASCVRVLLRFLFVTGQVPRDLAPAVPSVAGWRLASLPRRLDTASVAAVLGGCDRASEAGRREYAIVVVLARLGLRAGEVAALRLEDIDWRSGEVTIAGKGGRRDKLPLLGDVGQALATYLRQGRPRCASRAVFVTLYAPRRALTASAVRSVVYHACAQAGIERASPHRLRHALASDLLAAGASLRDIAEILRHRHLSTTAIYAKVDRKALACLARPWPVQHPGEAR